MNKISTHLFVRIPNYLSEYSTFAESQYSQKFSDFGPKIILKLFLNLKCVTLS